MFEASRAYVWKFLQHSVILFQFLNARPCQALSRYAQEGYSNHVWLEDYSPLPFSPKSMHWIRSLSANKVWSSRWLPLSIRSALQSPSFQFSILTPRNLDQRFSGKSTDIAMRSLASFCYANSVDFDVSRSRKPPFCDISRLARSSPIWLPALHQFAVCRSGLDGWLRGKKLLWQRTPVVISTTPTPKISAMNLTCPSDGSFLDFFNCPFLSVCIITLLSVRRRVERFNPGPLAWATI